VTLARCSALWNNACGCGSLLATLRERRRRQRRRPGVRSILEALHRCLVEEIWEKSNLDAIDELVDDGVVACSPHGVVRSRAEFKEHVRLWTVPFPDQTVEIAEMAAIPDGTVVRWSARGTHTGGDFHGVPPTHRHVLVTGLTITHWARRKMITAWSAYDMLRVLEQLTAVDQRGGCLR